MFGLLGMSDDHNLLGWHLVAPYSVGRRRTFTRESSYAAHESHTYPIGSPPARYSGQGPI
jgi:hypothetical protein